MTRRNRARGAALLLACAVAGALHCRPAGSQTAPPPGEDLTKEATLTRAAAEQSRIIRALNQVRLRPEQAAALAKVLDEWQVQQRKVDVDGAVRILAAETVLRQLLATPPRNRGAETDPSRTTEPLEQALAARNADLRTLRDTTNESLRRYLEQSLSPEQRQALLGIGRELLLQQRLAGTSGTGVELVAGSLRELEGLRAASDDNYPRLRDVMARRLAGAMSPDAMRGMIMQLREARQNGAPPPSREVLRSGPPITDPAMKARADRAANQLDQVRAMSPALWAQRRETIATQFARERQAAEVQTASPETLLRAFVESILLHPQSREALRARYEAPSR